jgi:hypothetical protein
MKINKIGTLCAGTIVWLAVTVTSVLHAQTTLSGNGLGVNLDDAGGNIGSLQYGGEWYALGYYNSDWGLQTGTDTSTFVRNGTAGGFGQTGPTTTLVSSSATSASYSGTYTTGGADVSFTRSYSILPSLPVLSVTMNFQNNGDSAITLRYFETYDPDAPDGASPTYNGQLTLDGITAAQAVRDDGSAVVLGSINPAVIANASSFGFEGPLSGDDLNSMFTSGGANSGGALEDDSIDLGFQITLAAGATYSLVTDQAYGSTAVLAQSAFTSAQSVPEPGTWLMMLVGGGFLFGFSRYRARRS